MLVFFQNVSDVKQVQSEVIKNAGRSSVQPYIIATGGRSLDQATAFYVVLDSNLYTTKSAAAAIDFCFKMFFVLGAQYPASSKHIWKLIQKGLYKINPTEVKDEIIPYMEKTYAILLKQKFDTAEERVAENQI